MRIKFVIVISLLLCTPALAIDPPPAAMKLIEEFKAKEKVAKDKLEAEVASLRAKAAKETEESKKQLVAELVKVRATLEKEKHNEARAVSARIRSITAPPIRAAVAPQNMSAYASNSENIDKSFVFRVTGLGEISTVWGTGPYTSDSNIYRAGVHAGVISNGESCLVKITLISTAGMDFAGSTQNGVTTSPYTEYATGYRIERVTSEEAEGVIEAEDPIPPAGISEDAESRSSTIDVFSGFVPASGPAPTVKRLGPRSTIRPTPKK
jgi:LCCL domain